MTDTLFTSALTVDGVFRQRLERDPDSPFLKCGGDWLSLAELDERVDRLAAGLQSLGIERGSMLATMLPNRIETVEIMLATAKLGAVQVPLNYFLKGDFLRYQLDDCAASVLIADGQGHAAAESLLGDTPMQHLVLVDDAMPGSVHYSELFSTRGSYESQAEPSDMLAIMYTSGTTAAAKGCMLSTGYYVNIGRQYGMREWVVPGDRVVTAFPMFHTSGQMVAFMSGLVNGASISIAPEFHASTFLDEATVDGATTLMGVGVMANMILAQPPKPDDRKEGFRLAVWVPLAEKQQLAFETRFNIPVMAEGYGQTEVVPVTNSSPYGIRKRDTSGEVSPLLEVRIVDDDDNEVPVGDAGEIVVRPKLPNVMYSGYWSKSEITVETWSNLWHHTGDYGRADADGFVTFVDRKKDIIRRRGENVSALALEILIRELPAVQDVAVSAVWADIGDEEIKASLMLVEGATITPEEFYEYLDARVQYFAIPRYVEIRESLPMNALSRVMKHVLKEEGVTDAMWDLSALGLTGRKPRSGETS